MKRLLMSWLAIVILLGLDAFARAQGGGGGQGNAHQENLQPAGQYPQQIESEAVSQSLNSQYAWNLGVTTGWDLANPTADLSLTPADDALRAHLGLPKDQGLIVTALAANTSAAQAGIEQNDVLLKLGEASLAKPDDLEAGLKRAGEKPASLTILRRGKKLTVQVQPQVRVTMGPVRPEPPAFWIGISVSPLEPALRSQLKLPPNQGLLAIEIIKDGPAAKAEVKVHDILLSLAEKPLDSQQKLVELVQANGEKSVPLELIREGKTQTVQVTLQRRKPAQPQVANFGVNARTLNYQLVNPGYIVGNAGNTGEVAGTFTLPNQSYTWQPQAAAGNVSTRLDELDSQIKQLRKAVEELSSTLKQKK